VSPGWRRGRGCGPGAGAGRVLRSCDQDHGEPHGCGDVGRTGVPRDQAAAPARGRFERGGEEPEAALADHVVGLGQRTLQFEPDGLLLGTRDHGDLKAALDQLAGELPEGD